MYSAKYAAAFAAQYANWPADVDSVLEPWSTSVRVFDVAVPASRSALKRAGLSLDQMDVIESNEAFAAQACAVANQRAVPTVL